MSLQLTLLFDPLCGWCYGAHPALAAVDAELAPDWQLLPTGLFTEAQPMSREHADYFWQNDQRIAALTGQVFSTAYREQVLSDLATPFDSGAATLAWQLIAAERPRQGLAILHAVQKLRYMDGLQHTPTALSALAASFGLEVAAFEAALAQGPTPTQLAERTTARQLMQLHQLRGVPALLARQGDALFPVDGRLLYDPASLRAALHRLTH